MWISSVKPASANGIELAITILEQSKRVLPLTYWTPIWMSFHWITVDLSLAIVEYFFADQFVHHWTIVLRYSSYMFRIAVPFVWPSDHRNPYKEKAKCKDVTVGGKTSFIGSTLTQALYFRKIRVWALLNDPTTCYIQYLLRTIEWFVHDTRDIRCRYMLYGKYMHHVRAMLIPKRHIRQLVKGWTEKICVTVLSSDILP